MKTTDILVSKNVIDIFRREINPLGIKIIEEKEKKDVIDVTIGYYVDQSIYSIGFLVGMEFSRKTINNES